MATHEYAVIGHNKARIGRWLSISAGAIAAISTLAVGFLPNLAQHIGINPNLATWLAVPISTGLAFTIVYWVFDHWAWRCVGVKHVINVPDLSGVWRVAGQRLDGELVVNDWEGTLTIQQTWDKIEVTLETQLSVSNSVTASLVRQVGRGYVLHYSYQNQPRMGQPQLNHHVGYSEITFTRDLKSGDGLYFNNLGRLSYGRMLLERTQP